MTCRFLVTVIAIAALSSSAVAALPFHDDFESGTGNWTKFPGAAETLQLAQDKWKSIDPGPWGVHEGHSARAFAYVGGGNGYMSYYDFGVQEGPIRAEVYMFEDYTTNQDPIWGGMSLIGAGDVTSLTDNLRIGIMQWSGTNSYYAAATKGAWLRNDTDETARKSGWTKLTIETDGVGGQVRYYVDDYLLATGTQIQPLQYIALGFNQSNYENFWYDGVRITPEPATAALLLIGLGVVARRRRA